MFVKEKLGYYVEISVQILKVKWIFVKDDDIFCSFLYSILKIEKRILGHLNTTIYNKNNVNYGINIIFMKIFIFPTIEVNKRL